MATTATSGVLLTATDPGTDMAFWSANASNASLRPELRIRWWAAEGVREFFQYEEFPLSTRRQARVNVGNGNLIINETDMAIAGTAGHDLVLSRTHNALNRDQADYGPRWYGNALKARITTYVDDSHVTFTFPDGYLVTWLSDSSGGYVAQQRVDARLEWDTSISRFVITMNDSGEQWRFYDFGKLDDIVDRSGNLIDYRYNAVTGLLEEIVDTRGRSVEFTYNGTASDSLITQIEGPTGRDIDFTYDGSDRLTTVVDTDGNTTTYTWNADGDMSRIDEPEGHQTRITYYTRGAFNDRIKTLTRVTSGTTGPTGPTTSFDYALDCTSIDPAYDTDACTVVTNPLGQDTVFYLDSRGRVTRTVDDNGRVQEIGYDSDNNVVAYTPETAGTPITSTYSTDGLNNLLSVAAPTGATTSFTYTDNPYAPSKVTTPQGDNTVFDYDASGRVTDITDANSGTGTITYNSDGTVDTVADPNTGVTDYDYNSDGELILIDAPGPLGDVDLTYDALSRSDAAGTYTTSYDKLNRITNETLPGSRSLSYTYDANGGLTALTDPSGTTSYTYNNVGLLDTLTVGSDVVDFTYDTRNRPNTIDYPNGVTIDNSYDSANRLTGRTVTGPGPTSIENWAWDYTLSSSDTALVQTETSNGALTTYGYDSLDRLVSADTYGGDSYAWTWDANNNRLSETLNGSTSNWTYNAANQITNSGYTYDSAGNRTAGGIVSVLGYDKLNRTTDLDGITATYLGAGQGEIDSLDGDTITRALPGLAVDDGYRIIRTPSGQPIGLVDGTDTYWLITDRLGSVTGITDNTGTEIVSYDYSPFGEVTITGTNPIKDQPIGYAGGYTDRASGLINYGQRWYDARSPLWDSPLLAGGQWEEIGSRDTRSQPNPPMSGIGISVGPTWLSATLSAALPPSS